MAAAWASEGSARSRPLLFGQTFECGGIGWFILFASSPGALGFGFAPFCVFTLSLLECVAAFRHDLSFTAGNRPRRAVAKGAALTHRRQQLGAKPRQGDIHQGATNDARRRSRRGRRRSSDRRCGNAPRERRPKRRTPSDRPECRPHRREERRTNERPFPVEAASQTKIGDQPSKIITGFLEFASETVYMSNGRAFSSGSF